MAYDMFLNGCLELLAVYGSEIILIQIHPGSGTKVEAVRAQDQHLGTFLIRIPMRKETAPNPKNATALNLLP